MRTVMLIASIMTIGSGVFCVANSSAAFLSLAFVIGLVLIILGACEIIVGWRADFAADERGVGLAKDGVIMALVGLAVFTGQVSDEISAQAVFALLLTVEGILSFRPDWLDIMNMERSKRYGIAFSAMLLVLGIYMFFNTSTLKLPVGLLIGIALILLGLRRFGQSFMIEYNRPNFITGNEEKLREAEEEEKRGLAKAKEGIREQKSAQRKIKKIKEDIAAEGNVMMSATITREERAAERELEE